MMVVLLLLFVFLLSTIETIETANILLIHPLPLKSHYNAFRPLAKALAVRGHRVTSMNHFPENATEYDEIDLSRCLPSKEFVVDIGVEESAASSRTVPDKIRSMYSHMADEERYIADCGVLFNETVSEARRTGKPYDLVMAEIFFNEAYLGLAWKFRAPIVALYANRAPPWLAESTATLDNPSYVTYTHNPWRFDFRRPTFSQRAYNAFAYFYTGLSFRLWFRPTADRIVRTYLGRDIPPVADIEANVSLILSFANVVINGPKDSFANVVEVGGLHMEQKESALPKDIEKFINESPHGVVYFSMGSLIKSESLPDQKREAFLHAFSKIPQRVLWKWNGDLLGKTENIFVSKWLPQRDILAHPKVKLFITHGGALGINEAICEGVPILGIPIYGDQSINVQNMVSRGTGELLDYYDISNASVSEKIQLILNNPRYAENMKKLSAIYRDRPMSALDTAVYWTEYVIRHKGAYHLRSPAIHLSWYQYLLLDVIAFVTTITFVTIYISYRLLRLLISLLFSLRKKSKTEKKTN